ncbi:MAG: AAA family ATPase, partial [Prevotellaceae bacterium]|nr:AAA family ATPase [Prevotellaceae bacterium]
MSKLFPIGIQNFESLRQDGYMYVDKTALIYALVKTGRYYFLSRPRRFGKSLLISTLRAYFEGKRELFGGLAIERLEEDWQAHPILHIDLNTEKYDTPQSLESILNFTLGEWEQLYSTDPSEVSLALRFRGIVKRACEQTGKRVVILVDEYDKPMLQAIGNEELQQSFRTTLKPFYGVLKTMDAYIKFALLTGVTKFGKVSVFSDLNNLNDISMDERYVELCGMTEQEIHR